MTNKINTRQHRERSQPRSRRRLGLLEKKKDYELRRKDYKAKQERIKKLGTLAENRNDDEFYFGMIHRKTNKGVAYGDRGNQVLSEDALRLLRTQDANYLKTIISIETKAIEKLENLVIKASEAKHFIFTDTGGKCLQHEQSEANVSSGDAIEQKFPSSVKVELKARLERLEQLKIVQQEIALQRNLQQKGPRRLIGTGKDGIKQYKWTLARKK